MKIDFNKEIDRRSTLSYKWHVAENELPMWIADMDFEVPDPVKDAVVASAMEGIYGYSVTPKELFSSVAGFFKRRHGVDIDTEWMGWSNGAIAGVAAAIRAFSKEGDGVVVCSPVYNMFHSSIRSNGRVIVESNLVYDGKEFSIDWKDLEEKLSDPKNRVMIICNPHNPVGKIWTREELARIAELCYLNRVKIISDEVHCDFVKPGLHYTPFYSVSDLAAKMSATIVAGSKTFNMAGVQTGITIVPNAKFRERIARTLRAEELDEPSFFASRAMIAAFSECDEWVDELQKYVFENRRIAYDYIIENIPELKPVKADATYLLWVDVSDVLADSVEFCSRLRALTGLYISAGTPYGECAKGFVRINLATQTSRILDGMERLRDGVNKILGR